MKCSDASTQLQSIAVINITITILFLIQFLLSIILYNKFLRIHIHGTIHVYSWSQIYVTFIA